MLAVESKKRRFWLSVFWFGAAEMIHLGWLTSDRYVGHYILVFYLLAVFALGFQFGFLSLGIPDSGRMSLRRILFLSSLWVLFEWSRLFVFTGFTWDPVGMSLAAFTSSMQLASITGVFGLSFWVIFCNLLALSSLSLPLSLPALGRWGLACLFPFLFGGAKLAVHNRAMKGIEEDPLSVVLVQTALYPEEKVAYSNEGGAFSPLEQWARIFQLLTPFEGKNVDLIVLPEGCVPYGTDLPIFSGEHVKRLYRAIFPSGDLSNIPSKERAGNGDFARLLADHFNADVLVGLDHQDQNQKHFNSGHLYTPGQISRKSYEKQILLPLGEYIPFQWCKKFIEKRYGITDLFAAGNEIKVLEGRSVPLGVSICYEETFGNLMRKNRLSGAKLFVNLTNDCWYPRSRLPLVHYHHGRLRTVENGIPLVRACNTGYTCGVDSLGRQVASLPPETRKERSSPGALHLNLPIYSYRTLYSTCGDQMIIGIALLLLVGGLIKKRR